jgi:hypothetical protein
MEIIDNFLPEDIFCDLEEVFLGTNFPWFYNKRTVFNEGNQNYQFTHTFVRETGELSDRLYLIEPVLDKIKPKEVIRAKINMGPRDFEAVETGWHTDFMNEPDVVTATFYINDNNGYTLFDDGTKVESVRNRLATFPCDTRHTGVSHTDTQVRVVLNLNYTL